MAKGADIRKEKIPIREQQQRGTALFPLQYNYCNTANPCYDLWLHWHTEFEIIHVISGTYKIFINDHDEVLNEGDLCIINANVIHGDSFEKGLSKYESVVFDIELMRLHGFSTDSFISDIVNENICIENIYRFNNHKDIIKITLSFFETIRDQRDGWEAISTGYLIILFGLIKKNKLYSEKKFVPARDRIKNEKLELVFDFIKRNYMKNISLKELADVAGFSPKYFCRIFGEMTNRAPVEYLNWFRVNRACAMIRETDEKLQDIALKCGFNDFSYFIKIFHRYEKMTPLKYRNYKDSNNSDLNIDYDVEYERLLKQEKED